MNSASRVALAIPVGIPIVYIGTVVLCGSFDNANMMILLSIVCTLGLSLLAWLPLCWFVGWLTLLIISALFGLAKEEPIEAVAVDSPKLTRDEIAVIRYMWQTQRSGIAPSVTDEVLRRNGWSEAIIKRARQYKAPV